MDRSGFSSREPGLQMHRLHHTGRDPVRVLLIGDRSQLVEPLRGGTVAERIADRMWLSTRRGVDLDVLTDLAPVLRAVQGVFKTWRLWRYDLVLVALGEGLDSAQRPRTLARVGALLEEVLADAAVATEVVVLAPARAAAGRSETGATGRLQAVIGALASPRVRYREVRSAGDPVEHARAWAAMAGAETVVSVGRAAARADAASAALLRNRPDEEAARQRALDDLHIIGSEPDARLDDLVELARTAFGTQSAEINFIDHDRQWKMAVAGSERSENPRAHSFCASTIQRSSPTVIADAQVDPVLRGSPLAHGPHAIRFYAAHPIESVDGYRIGSFCIYDPEPRDVSGLNLDVLRDLALLAQAEIVGDAAPAGSSLRR